MLPEMIDDILSDAIPVHRADKYRVQADVCHVFNNISADSSVDLYHPSDVASSRDKFAVRITLDINKNRTEKYPQLAFRDCCDIDKRQESCVLYTYSTRFYDMELVFKLSVSDIALNNATKFLSNEHIIIPDAFDFKLTMTLPFIPSKEEIQEYADIIESQKEINGKLIEQVRFTGYNYVYPVTEKAKE